MVLRLLVSFCNSEGNWRKGAHSAESPSPVTFTAPPPYPSPVEPTPSPVPPSLTHLGQPTVLQLKDPGFLRGFHVSAEGTVSHPGAAARAPAGRKRSCHRAVQARSHPPASRLRAPPRRRHLRQDSGSGRGRQGRAGGPTTRPCRCSSRPEARRRQEPAEDPGAPDLLTAGSGDDPGGARAGGALPGLPPEPTRPVTSSKRAARRAGVPLIPGAARGGASPAWPRPTLGTRRLSQTLPGYCWAISWPRGQSLR